MSSDGKSAIVRAARTAIQIGAAWVAAWLIVQVPSLGQYESELLVVLTVVFGAAFAWVWRRWIDPSSVPSLVDIDTFDADTLRVKDI